MENIEKFSHQFPPMVWALHTKINVTFLISPLPHNLASDTPVSNDVQYTYMHVKYN